MIESIETGQLAFIREGTTAIGSVRGITNAAITIYVENSGDFRVPVSAVKAVHDGKVIFDSSKLDKAFLAAIRHEHDSEVPDDAGEPQGK